MFCERGLNNQAQIAWKVFPAFEREGERDSEPACLPEPGRGKGREHTEMGRQKRRQDRAFQDIQLNTLLGYFCQTGGLVLQLHNIKMFLNSSLVFFLFFSFKVCFVHLYCSFKDNRTRGEHSWNTWSLAPGREKQAENEMV